MALTTSLMAMLLMIALTGGLTLMTITESAIALNHRVALQTVYAAEAGVELGISYLRLTSDWVALVGNGSAMLVTVPLADVAQVAAVDRRYVVTVTASPDPAGNPDVLVLRSNATGPGGTQRALEVTITRLPPDASGARTIETTLWR